MFEDFEIFKDLDYYDKNRIGDSIKREIRKPKDIIVKQGDDPDYFYVIKKGEVVVSVKGEDKSKQRKLT